MNTPVVSKLFDLRQLDISPKLLEITVDAGRAQDGLRQVAARHTVIVAVEGSFQHGDIVAALFCAADQEPQELFLHIGSGFEQAALERLAEGKQAGFSCPCSWRGVSGELKLLYGKRPICPELTDDHVRQLGLGGVETVSQYREYLLCRIGAYEKRKRLELLCGMVLKQAASGSHIVASPAQKQAAYESYIAMLRQQYRVPPEVLNGDFALDFVTTCMGKQTESPREAEEILLQKAWEEQVKSLLCQAYAQQDGVSFDEAAYEARLSAYAQQTGSPVRQLKQQYPYGQFAVLEPQRYVFNTLIPAMFADKLQVKINRNGERKLYHG